MASWRVQSARLMFSLLAGGVICLIVLDSLGMPFVNWMLGPIVMIGFALFVRATFPYSAPLQPPESDRESRRR